MECLHSFIAKNKMGMYIPVPCGKCPNCIKRRISAWSFRLMQEEKISTSAYFITLTYDTSTVPISKNGFMSLDKAHVQKFFKKLRKDQWNKGNVNHLKYYLAGEYGDRKKRPHYHVIVFNLSLDILIGEKMATQVRLGNILLDGKTNFQNQQWDKGHITIGEVNNASVGYTLMYLHKPWKPMHKNDDRQPQFSLMSKKLGMNYLSDKMVEWYRADIDNRLYCNIEDGKKIAMPRYYKDKLFEKLYPESPELAELHRKRVGNIQLRKMEEKLHKVLDPIATDQEFRKYIDKLDAAKLAAYQKQEMKQKTISQNF